MNKRVLHDGMPQRDALKAISDLKFNKDIPKWPLVAMTRTVDVREHPFKIRGVTVYPP